jgi:transcriptional regulator with GAF, ATPase, and Fis domain
MRTVDPFPHPPDAPPSDRSATRFADIARSLAAEPDVARTLQRIVDLAVETIDGCEGAGLLIVSRGKILAGSWSDEAVHAVEQLEYEIGEGPCIDAILSEPTFETDLRDQAERWPTFVAHAVAAGFESILAFRLFAAEDILGALNLYSRSRGAFDEAARAFGGVYAAHAALALAGAQVHAHDVALVNGLHDALIARDVIGQAKGILMATRHIDAEGAFALLRTTSQELNIKLRVVAEDVALTGALPDSGS